MRMKTCRAVCFSLLFGAPMMATAEGSDRVGAYDFGGAIKTDLRYSEQMFDRQDNVTNKVAVSLRARQSGVLEPGSFYLGGRLLLTYIGETSNTAGKFPILSRLPPTHTSGHTDAYGVLNDASLNATVTLPWVTVFAQGEYTEIEYPGQDDLQLRKYWIAIGDLDRYPFYLAVGRKTLNFGNFASYAPFTHTHNSHYFWAQADDPVIELGYVTDRTELALTLIPDQRGLRVVSSPEKDGGISNFALNGSHRFDLQNGNSLTIGAGYLRGTIYDSTLAHHPPDEGILPSWNAAYTFNAVYSGSNFDIMAEFTTTDDIWPATDHKVTATTLQGRYRSSLLGKPASGSCMPSLPPGGEPAVAQPRWEETPP